MQRSSAGQIARFEGTLAETPCVVCGTHGIRVLAQGRNDNGAIQRFYCSIEPCAKAEGWPWLNGDGWKRAA